ncbi:unnamed protein product, partial [Polarella glacialis]
IRCNAKPSQAKPSKDMTNSFHFMFLNCGLMDQGDVGHPGVNNVFHVNSRHELAITCPGGCEYVCAQACCSANSSTFPRYNDRSVLENFHAAELQRQMYESDVSRGVQGCCQSLQDLGNFRVKLGTEAFDPVNDSGDQQMVRHSCTALAAAQLIVAADLSATIAPACRLALGCDDHWCMTPSYVL